MTNTESIYEKTLKEKIKLKKQVEQLETSKQKLIEKLEEDIKLKEKEYEKILNSIDRKVSHTKDEHKIRSIYAELGIKKGEMEAYKKIRKFFNEVVMEE